MEKIIFGIPLSQLITGLITVIVGAIIFVILLSFYLNKKRKKAEQAAAEKKKAEDLKRGYYIIAKDHSRFTTNINCKNEQLCIVTEEKAENEFILSLSHPLFKDGDMNSMVVIDNLEMIYGVISMDKLNAYQISVKTSLADIKRETNQMIMQLLFRWLEKMYPAEK